MTTPPTRRREFLKGGAIGASRSRFPHRPGRVGVASGHRRPPASCSARRRRAHLDTFDPKRRGDGKKAPGSYYDAIPTAISGVSVCAHLRRVARRLDPACWSARCTPDHRRARRGDETCSTPAAGQRDRDLPVARLDRRPRAGRGWRGGAGLRRHGYPRARGGPGFPRLEVWLVYLIDTEAGPTGLTPRPTSPGAPARREALLEGLRSDFQAQHPGELAIADYAAAGREAARLAARLSLDVFRLDREPSARRASYGGEFGQRCLWPAAWSRPAAGSSRSLIPQLPQRPLAGTPTIRASSSSTS